MAGFFSTPSQASINISLHVPRKRGTDTLFRTKGSRYWVFLGAVFVQPSAFFVVDLSLGAIPGTDTGILQGQGSGDLHQIMRRNSCIPSDLQI